MTSRDDRWWREHDRNTDRDRFAREGQKARRDASIRDPADGMAYVSQMGAIKQELDWISQVLDHIVAYLRSQHSA